MSKITGEAPASGRRPSNAWIKFLRSYGPTPNNTTLFDEYVTGALGKAKVVPITLSSPELEKIKAHLTSGARGSILIAGTAGDGKTYHCRSLWTELGGLPQDWAGPAAVKEVTLKDGRIATFIKDLSELTPEQSEFIRFANRFKMPFSKQPTPRPGSPYLTSVARRIGGLSAKCSRPSRTTPIGTTAETARCKRAALSARSMRTGIDCWARPTKAVSRSDLATLWRSPT